MVITETSVLLVLGVFCVTVWSSDPEGLRALCQCLNCIRLEVCLCKASNLGSCRQCDRDLSANVSGINDVSCENPFKFVNKRCSFVF